MFHQIYELMVLGMHPAISYPRRNQNRPRWEMNRCRAGRSSGARLLYGIRAAPDPRRRRREAAHAGLEQESLVQGPAKGGHTRTPLTAGVPKLIIRAHVLLQSLS